MLVLLRLLVLQRLWRQCLLRILLRMLRSRLLLLVMSVMLLLLLEVRLLQWLHWNRLGHGLHRHCHRLMRKRNERLGLHWRVRLHTWLHVWLHHWRVRV